MAHGEDWTREELRASVNAYLDMLQKFRGGVPFVKKSYYRDLASTFGRTEKAFEYRAQNISHVLALQGRQWLPGLVPAKNVGPTVTAEIERILAEAEGVPNSGRATFEARVYALKKKKRLAKPKGNKKPKGRISTSTAYERDPQVVAYIVQEAKGRCEACQRPAPFTRINNEPFLEVHHVRQLADGGSDTVSNAVAICPNCHRALHHSIDRDIRISALFKQIERLVPE